MARINTVQILIVTSLLLIPIAGAGDDDSNNTVTAEPIIFGGVWADAYNNSTSSQSLSNLPIIAEDYTATWCENCVKAEHALDDIANVSGNILKMHYHRYIGETQDPFGSQESDEYWERRYEARLPPTIVFNGISKHVGSTPKLTDNLTDDYRLSVERELELGEGHSKIDWTTIDNNTGSISWELNYSDSTVIFNGSESVKSFAVVIEDIAEFPEGSNGEIYYYDIVRSWIDLGSDSSGSKQITLPDPWDGDDLRVILLHDVIVPQPSDTTPDNQSDTDSDKEDSGLSAIGILTSTLVIFASAIWYRSRN